MSRGAASFQALPHSEESERAVLAAILLSPTVLDQVVEVLEVRDLYLEKHQLIYGSMVDLWKEGHSIDLRTVQAKLELQNSFELIGGLPYLTGLDTFLPDISRVMEYAEVVKERSARRHLMAMADNVSSACVSSGLEAKQIVAEAERELAMIWVGESSEWVSAKEGFEESDAIRQEQRDGTRATVTTGIAAFDAITGPIEAGEFLIVGGNPKMGKSSYARQLLLRFSKYGPVVFVTLEEPIHQVVPKMACSLASVDFTKWRTETLAPYEEERYYEARKEIERRDIRFVGSGTGKKRELPNWAGCKRIFRKAAKKGLAASAVDYLQQLVETKDVNWELENISKEYARICLELKMVGVGVSQLNRSNTKRTFKKSGETEKWQDHVPTISDFRGSGGIEQAGTKLIFPFRPHYYEPDNDEFRPYYGMEKAMIILAANRNGPIGTASVRWEGATMSYLDTSESQRASW